jgi:hypothetical protein
MKRRNLRAGTEPALYRRMSRRKLKARANVRKSAQSRPVDMTREGERQLALKTLGFENQGANKGAKCVGTPVFHR